MPELATNVTSLLILAANYSSTPGPYVGHVQFELDFPHPMAIGVSVFGLVVSVCDWSAGAAPALDDGAVLPAYTVGMLGEAAGSSW